MTYRNRALLGLARQAPHCMACFRHNDGDVVAAHRNEDKGIGMKAPDFAWAALCGSCHADLDQGKEMLREDRRAFWMGAYWRTQSWLWNSGHLIVSVEPTELPPQPEKPKRKIKGRTMQSRPFAKAETPRKIASRPFPKRADR